MFPDNSTPLEKGRIHKLSHFSFLGNQDLPIIRADIGGVIMMDRIFQAGHNNISCHLLSLSTHCTAEKLKNINGCNGSQGQK